MAALVIALMIQLGFPAGTKVVLANEVEWFQLTRRFNATATHEAFTLRNEHIVVLRLQYAQQAQASGSRELARTLAHELGHIECQCNDEGTAWRYAGKILKRAKL